jgi:hypothetical protein
MYDLDGLLILKMPWPNVSIAEVVVNPTKVHGYPISSKL